MTFVEVAKSLKSVVPTRPEVDYHHSIAVGDTIYVFSQKYNAQPTFNWGQRVIHKGGYEASFDTKTNEWSGPVDFEAITTDENVDEALFALGSRLFLVLFSSFGGLEFLGAHEWVDKKWKKLQFSADAESKQSDDASQYVKFVVVDGEYNGEKLLITYVNSTPRVHGLKVEGDKVTLSTLYTVDDEDALRPLFFPVSGFVSGSKLRYLNAARGCGVRVQLQELVEVDLDAKTAKNVQGDHPPFTGLGARSTFLADPAHWVHTTGGTAHGMYDTNFNGQLWQLSVETDSPQWQQLKTTVPDNLEDGDLQVVAVNGTLYVIKPENGVFKGEIH